MDIKETDNKKLTHNLRRPFGIGCKWKLLTYDNNYQSLGVTGLYETLYKFHILSDKAIIIIPALTLLDQLLIK